MNLAPRSEPVNRKQLIQEQWSPFFPFPPLSAEEAFSRADGWLAYSICFCLFFSCCSAFFSHFTLPFSFLLALCFQILGVGGQGEVAGLSRGPGPATDSFPQVDGLLLNRWQCHLPVTVNPRVFFVQKCPLLNESSGSRYKD